MLQVDLDRFAFGDKTVLKDISLTLEKDRNLTIMGANGCGKSTLAKIMCALYKTKKSVKIDGEYVERISDKKRALKINYIPPKLQIYDSYVSVKEYLRLSRIRGEIESALTVSGLYEKQDLYCKDLSSGEAQLLLVASALCHGGEITVFDEPVSNLDPKKVKTVFDILKGDMLLQKIVITHNLQFAYKLGYPIFFMQKSGARLYDDCDEFFDKENLFRLFGGSVVKRDDIVVIEL